MAIGYSLTVIIKMVATPLPERFGFPEFRESGNAISFFGMAV
jgi:hypothetical protein